MAEIMVLIVIKNDGSMISDKSPENGCNNEYG